VNSIKINVNGETKLICQTDGEYVGIVVTQIGDNHFVGQFPWIIKVGGKIEIIKEEVREKLTWIEAMEMLNKNIAVYYLDDSGQKVVYEDRADDPIDAKELFDNMWYRLKTS